MEGGTVANFRWDLAGEETCIDVYGYKLLEENETRRKETRDAGYG